MDLFQIQLTQAYVFLASCATQVKRVSSIAFDCIIGHTVLGGQWNSPVWLKLD